MVSKLGLNQNLIDSARLSARKIAEDVQEFIDKNTTVAVERTVARLLGVDGVDEIDKPLPNVLIDNIAGGGGLSKGAAFWIGNAIVQTGLTPQIIAEKISCGEIDITRLPIANENKIMEEVYNISSQTVEKIRNNRIRRDNYLKSLGEGENLIYM